MICLGYQHPSHPAGSQQNEVTVNTILRGANLEATNPNEALQEPCLSSLWSLSV